MRVAGSLSLNMKLCTSSYCLFLSCPPQWLEMKVRWGGGQICVHDSPFCCTFVFYFLISPITRRIYLTVRLIIRETNQIIVFESIEPFISSEQRRFRTFTGEKNRRAGERNKETRRSLPGTHRKAGSQGEQHSECSGFTGWEFK